MRNQLKRIGALALTFAILVGMMVFPSANAVLLDETITLGFGEVKDTTTSVGGQSTEVVAVPVTATASTPTFEVRPMELYVTFNKDVLKLVKVTKGKIPDTEIPNPDDPDEPPTKNPLNLSNSAAALATANEKGCYKAVFSDLTENSLNHIATSGEPVMTMYFTRTTNDSSVISFVPPASDPDYASKKQIIATAATDEYKVNSDATVIVPAKGGDQYTVTFDKNGGEGSMDAQTFTAPAALNENTFTREGYDFTGWNTKADGSGTAYADKATYNGSGETLYAQWQEKTPVEYKVTFDKNGGSGSMPDQTFTAPAALNENKFTRDGYDFTGWNTKADGTGTAYADKANYTGSGETLYAQWKEKTPEQQHKVKFDANGGSDSMPEVTVEQGQKLILPECTFTPPAGKQFKAWDVNGEEKAPNAQVAISADITVKAVWEPIVYTVTYKANGGAGDDVVENADAGSTVTLKAKDTFTAPEGQQFKAWLVDGAEKQPGDSITVNANTEIKAVWEKIPEPYTVKFDANGGSGSMDDVKVNQGAQLTLPACAFTAPDGKVFKAWDVNGAEKNPGDKVDITADNTTVKAVWQDKPSVSCKVTFDANGGSGTMDAITTDDDGKMALPSCDFTPPDGKMFDGWEVNGATKQPGDEVTFSADTTVKALWREPASGGCYVATSVYGSYDCPQVWTLRRFRDNVLAQTWYGRLFIKAYYAVSPTCVKLFGQTEAFQNFFRGVLDPFVAALQADGFESTPYNDIDW